MYIFKTLIFLILPVQLLFGQNQVPDDLKKSKVIMIKYSYDTWDSQFMDSTRNQWVLNRYGKKVLYTNYIEAFDKVVTIFKRHEIEFTIVGSLGAINMTGFNYLFDYKQKIIDNSESIVADKDLGGFFFKDLKTNKKYDAIVENKRYIGRIIKKEL